MGIFLNFHKLGGHNKITLGEDCKSTLKIRQGDGAGRGGLKIKWRGEYLFLEKDSAAKFEKEKQENKLNDDNNVDAFNE